MPANAEGLEDLGNGVILEKPQFSIVAQSNPAKPGKVMIGLQVAFGMALHQFYLCDTKDYEQIARQFHKQIMEAGVQAKRQESGIVVANGEVGNGLVRKAEGREQRGPSRPR